MSFVDDITLQDDAFVEIPGMRGLRVARVGAVEGKHLEVVEGAKGVIIPAMTNPTPEQGKVLSGSLRFMQEGVVTLLKAGDSWTTQAGEHQGPHVFLEDGTRVALLRDGRSQFDQ